MKCYRIKHKSGLFFTPSYGSSKLSKNGKLYTRKPNLKDCTYNGIYKEDDFEIITYTLEQGKLGE